jgi:hypothetical protein
MLRSAGLGQPISGVTFRKIVPNKIIMAPKAVRRQMITPDASFGGYGGGEGRKRAIPSSATEAITHSQANQSPKRV